MSTIDDRPCFIYAITHLKTGKRYVGSCLHPTRRWIEHRSQLKCQRHHCDHLQRTYNRDGLQAFSFLILKKLPTNQAFVRAKAELTFISAMKCFNSRTANLGLTNFVNSPATRAKINAGISKRLSQDAEFKQWLQARGAKLAEHAKTPERRAIRAALSKELWTDPEHREKISKKLAAHWKREGVREAHSERVKLIRGTPEARKKNSIAMKAAWSNPTSGLRNRKQTRWADPAAKEIQSAKLRAAWARRRAEKNQNLDTI